MKFHSDVKTIIISFLVLLLFVLTSVFIISELNLTSPTLIITSRIFNGYRDLDSDISVEFSSMERNLRDRVRFNEVSVGYKGEKIAEFESLEVKIGLLQIVQYLFTGKTVPTVAAENGNVTVPSSLLSSFEKGEEGSGEGKNLSSLDRFPFILKLSNFSLSLFDSVVVNDISMSLDFRGMENIKAEVEIPFLSASYEEYSLDFNGVRAEAVIDKDYRVSLSSEEVHLSEEKEIATLSSLFFSLDFSSLSSIKEGIARGKVDSFTFDYEGIKGDGKITLEKSSSISTLTLGDISIERGEDKAYCPEILISTSDFSSFQGRIGELKADILSYPIVVEGLSIPNFSLADKKGELSLSSLYIGKLEEISANQISSVSLKDVSIELEEGEKRAVSVSVQSYLEPTSPLLSAMELGIKGSLIFDGTDIESYSLSTSNLYLGYGERYPNSLSLNGDKEGAELLLTYGESRAELSCSFPERRLKGSIGTDKYLVSHILPFIDETVSLSSFFPAGSTFVGAMDFDLQLSENAAIPIVGRLDYDLDFDKVTAFGLESALRAEGSLSLKEDGIHLYPLKLDSDYFTLSVDCSLDYHYLLPSFSFLLTGKDGKEIANGDLSLLDGHNYSYYIGVPMVEETFMSGDISFSDNEFHGSNKLVTFGVERPFDFVFNNNDRTLDLNSSKLKVFLSLSEGIKGSLAMTGLDLVRDGKGIPMTVDSSISFAVTNDGNWEIKGDEVELSYLWFIPSSPSVGMKIEGENGSLRVKDIEIREEDETLLSGKADFDLASRAFTMALDNRDGSGDIILSFFKDDQYSGLVRARNIRAEAFGLSDMYCNINLTGRASRLEDISLEGVLEVLSNDSVNDERKMTAQIVLNSGSLLLDDIIYSNSGVEVSVDKIFWSSTEGTLDLEKGRLFMKGTHDDRDYPISAEFSFHASMDNNDNIYNSVYNTIRDGGEGITFSFNLDYCDLDNSKIYIPSKNASGYFSDRKIYFTGDMIQGEMSVDDLTFDLKLDAMPLIKTSLKGKLKGGIEANAEIEGFNMYLINMFLVKPTLVFNDDYVMGSAGIKEEDGNYILNGNLWAEDLSFTIFWAPDQFITMHNPRFDIWENDLISSVSKATVLDYKDYTRKTIDIYAGIRLTSGLSIEGYVAEMWMDENNPIRVRIPLPHLNIDILGYSTGHYYMDTHEGEPMNNNGELYLSDTVLSIGMNPYPEWYKLKGGTNLDLRLFFERNNRIVYPAQGDPIISITLDEDSDVYAYLKNGDMSVTGDIDIRGGEVFYFQKYFYITEGNISFPDPTRLDPVINLRATLRDYDSESNRVEIYLVLKDNTFENISPTLESSPAKDLNEIMDILGQSILPSSTYGTVSVGSVTSLVTGGLDILGRLGIVTAESPLSDLSSSLKLFFGVDSFSIHSNIVNNILSDTISSSLSDYSSNYSPMARFLDGTTLNVGKYLSSSFYLQGMIHLTANNNAKDKYTFISDDLVLDTEFSLDWMNPAFKITFTTSPSYFSLYSVMDTFKFSISKTINW